MVSPELHGNSYINTWKKYKELAHENLFLCTDKPSDADLFFNGDTK
jgi:hypothetical protein